MEEKQMTITCLALGLTRSELTGLPEEKQQVLLIVANVLWEYLWDDALVWDKLRIRLRPASQLYIREIKAIYGS
ncbi:hypothetical protein ACFLU8_05580 [Chloroflexota bacterium]